MKEVDMGLGSIDRVLDSLDNGPCKKCKQAARDIGQRPMTKDEKQRYPCLVNKGKCGENCKK